MHMCFYKKKKVPVILVCGSPQLTLSPVLYWSHMAPREAGGERVRQPANRVSKKKTREEEEAGEEDVFVIKGYGKRWVFRERSESACSVLAVTDVHVSSETIDTQNIH